MAGTLAPSQQEDSQVVEREPSSRVQTARRVVLFFLVLLVIYFANRIITPSKDTFANSILPFSILLHHDVFLGRYLTASDLSTAYYAIPFHGDYIPAYPIGPALTALPIYLLYLLFGGHASLYSGLIVGKLAAAVIVTISVLLFYKLLTNLGMKPSTRLLFTSLYALGSETFSIGSQALWQHGAAELWIVAFLFGASKIMHGTPRSLRPAYVSGLALGMLLLSRPQDIVIAVPFFLLLLFSSKRKYALHALPPFLLFALFNLLYNSHFYAEPTLRGGPTQIAGILTAPFSVGLAGNLISPSRGLLIFSPWALVSLLWLRKAFQRDFYRQVYAPTLLAVIFYILLYSKLGYWAAGFSFGPRYMTDISPALALLAAGYWEQWRTTEAWSTYLKTGIVGLFAVWSILIQFLGTYVPAYGWNVGALPDTFSPPLWSVREGEIAYYLGTLKAQLVPPSVLTHPSAKFLSVQLLDKPNIYTPGVTPSVYQAGTQYSGIATVENTGSEPWSVYPAQGGKHGVFLSYSVWKGGTKVVSEGELGVLLHPVRPGQKIPVYFYFNTPKQPGAYTYMFTLTQGPNGLFQTQLKPENAFLETIVVQ